LERNTGNRNVIHSPGYHRRRRHGRGVQRLLEDRAVFGRRRPGHGQPGQSPANGARASPGDPSRRITPTQHVRGPFAERSVTVRYAVRNVGAS